VTAQRYLLLLGSNLPGPERLQQASAALTRLGATRPLTRVTRTSARHDPSKHYCDVLVRCDGTDDRDALLARLKQLETALGRVRDASGEVAIDIDLLATCVDDAWQADPHALAKREFTQSPARELLADAGITVAGA
jgi:2-amino-4-hydroxy-6-hydroxymethyldihydropteridine diphosphokinase